jgi:uncharacterized protein YecT (DUF1311 family)
MRFGTISRPALVPALALALAVAGWGCALPAGAQAPSTADCTGELTPDGKAACIQAKIDAAEKTMQAAYDRLSRSLDARAGDHLRADQDSWRAARDPACNTPDVESAAGASPLDRRQCILSRIEQRTAWLAALPAGADYPYISDHTRTENGAVPGIRYGFSARYPRFDRPGVDYGAVNGSFAKAASEIFEKPDPADAIEGRTQDWSRELDYALAFPTRDIATVIEAWNAYLGGAHPNGGTSARMVHLPTGRFLAMKDLLVAGYVARILPAVQQDLRRQFRDNPGFDEALEPRKLTEMLNQDDRWIMREDKIEIVFNSYEVGPYVSGPYTVDLPYPQIAALIRKDGPLAAKAR